MRNCAGEAISFKRKNIVIESGIVMSSREEEILQKYSKKGEGEKDWRFAYVSKEVMDKISRFQVDIDGETFRKLFTQVGGSARMAEHLWDKFHVDYDHQILKLWLALDSENRVLVLAVINRWTGIP